MFVATLVNRTDSLNFLHGEGEFWSWDLRLRELCGAAEKQAGSADGTAPFGRDVRGGRHGPTPVTCFVFKGDHGSTTTERLGEKGLKPS